ncbi:SMI1/KNR4 family protein [Actinokineospora inagensis]|uniref:SMI1/KNR4 family protein n=1 Tax=Actinokineospora inagensis TaxID=103730 RepID=UPI000404C328|nr:SMI1/KNR4 family protein [Actinokineospora inagensis]
MSAVDDLSQLTGWSGVSYARTDWDVVESRLGVGLPADYKELHRVFPPGDFFGPYGDSIMFQPPYVVDGVPDQVRQFETEMGELEDWRQSHPEDVPVPLFPEPGGVLPWARTSRPVLLWVRDHADPDRWTVAASNGGAWRIQPEDPVLQYFPCGAAEFLLGFVTGDIWSRVLNPNDEEPDVPPARTSSSELFRAIPESEWLRMSQVSTRPQVRKISMRKRNQA